MNEHVYLIGMPGSGKSSVGRALAEVLDAPFVDLDEEIERDAGMPIPDIFREKGEEGFRHLEEAAVARVAGSPPSIVACGGGAPLREANRERLRATGVVVWLEAPAEKLWKRIRLVPRPLVKGPVDLGRLARERDAVYRELAAHRVRSDGEAVAVAHEVAEMLR